MVTRRARGSAVFAILGLFALAPASGCSSSSKGTRAHEGADGGGGSERRERWLQGCASDRRAATVTGRWCTCDSRLRTSSCKQVDLPEQRLDPTISGTIYDPAGKNPLYGVVAYVPNSPSRRRSPRGASPCSAPAATSFVYTGNPNRPRAITDAQGQLHHRPKAPDGARNIPLVIQVGKWRRQLRTPPPWPMCADTATPDKCDADPCRRNTPRATSRTSPSPPAAPTRSSACSAG